MSKLIPNRSEKILEDLTSEGKIYGLTKNIKEYLRINGERENYLVF